MRFAAGVGFSAVIGLLFLLSSCSINPAHQPAPQSATQDQANWLKHKKTLQPIHIWQFNGRFGAKTNTETWTGSINWSQQQQNYKINIAGPLSSGSIELEGEENYALLRLSDKHAFSDNNPQSLLQAHTGLKLPVNELRYWLLGLPAPEMRYTIKSFTQKGQLSKLQQNNWEVSFKRYTKVGRLQLPDKIFIENHDINVRLIIQKWQIRQ